QWRAQMVISCRTEYNGVEYKDHFQPTDRNNGGDTGQFQEAIISPFTKEQIRDYIGHIGGVTATVGNEYQLINQTGKIRLMEMELSPYDKKTFKRMTDSGFQRYGLHI
ncbi:hypothetical protein BGZ80_001827, partial [Entomortierella chlamydospora]